MRLTLSLVLAGLMLGVASMGMAREEKSKYTIKQVMKQAMAGKESLLKKVASGEGDKEDSAKLVELLTALSMDKPSKGDPDSWKEKTTALLKAAKDGDGKALSKAANCMACHKEHK